MNWIDLNSSDQLEGVIDMSFKQAVVIFKHSTRCSISLMAKSRLERQTSNEQSLDFYYLDLLNYRPISDLIASKFDVQHESPQLLLIQNGECIYHCSHGSIDFNDLVQYLKLPQS